MGMKMDKYVNKFLYKIFGPEDAQGNRKCYFHSQNLNEDRKGNVRGFPWEGRWWLNYNHRTIHHFSWKVGSRFCGAGIKSDHEDGGTMFHAALPPVALWVTLPIPLQEWVSKSPFMKKWNERTGGYKDSHRYTGFELFNLSFHDSTLFWTFLKFDWGWSNSMPKWMSGAWHPLDTFLGKTKYSKREIEKKEVFVPMPEGQYKAQATMEECTWKRPLWFPRVRTYVTLDIDTGIPHEGKGENDYDCGEDALFGCSGENTYENAISKAVESVLRSRRKYNGNMNAKYPTPEEREKAVLARREKSKAEREQQTNQTEASS